MLNRLRRIIIKSNCKELVAKNYVQEILDRFNKEKPLEQKLEKFYNLLNRGQTLARGRPRLASAEELVRGLARYNTL